MKPRSVPRIAPSRAMPFGVALNWRKLGPRVTGFMLVSATFVLLGMNRIDPALVERLQTATGDFISPAIGFLGQPLVSIRSGLGNISHASQIFSENAALREQNRKLIAWRDTALRLEAENASLRAHLHVAPDPESRQVMVRVIGDPAGGFVESLMLAAGTSSGLEKGQPAVTAIGEPGTQDAGALVGRIVQTGDSSARLLLVTDVNSRIPVLLEQSHIHAILGGDDTDRPQLLYLPPGSSVSVGERVVTSGNDHLMPPGIAVGVVVGNDENGIRVAPLADLSRIDFVTILKYEGVVPLLAPDTAVDKTRAHR